MVKNLRRGCDIVRHQSKDWVPSEHITEMDEAQLEVKADQVEFKLFPMSLAEHVEDKKEDYLKDLAQAFKNEQLEKTGKVWSDISHYDKNGGGLFVSYCKAGLLAVESVAESGKFYSTELVPIDLTAGYIVGQSWASCH